MSLYEYKDTKMENPSPFLWSKLELGVFAELYKSQTLMQSS